MSFWSELKRRKVLQVAIAYAIVAWLLIQIVVTVEAPLSLPAWMDTFVIVTLLLGFPVAVIIAWAFDLTPGGIRRTEAAELDPGPSAAVAPAVSVSPAPPAASVPSAGNREPAPGDTQRSQPVRTPPLPNSIAVLPLDNLSPDPNNAYFAAGLHEEILNQLAKLRALNVIARTSVLQYAGSRLPIPEIAAALNVRTVMEGSIRYAGERIRVTAQLIDATTGSHLWSETFDREFRDIFAIESEIAINVAAALAVELSLDERRSIERKPTSSPQAYALYLQALSSAGGGGSESEKLLERALAFDPEFVRAHHVKAQMHSYSLINSTAADAASAAERDRQVELALHHARRTAELDPAFAWFPKTIAALFVWEWSPALAVLDNAPDPLDLSGIFLHSYTGQHDKAIQRARAAVALDPENPFSHFALATSFVYAGRLTEGEQTLTESVAAFPTMSVLHSWLAFVAIALGKTDAAAAALERAEQLLADNRQVVFLPEMAYEYSRIGRLADVDRLAAEIEQAAGKVHIGCGGAAMLCLARGDRAGLIDQLERAIEKISRNEIDEGFYSLMNIRMNVSRDPALEDPQVAELRGRLRGR